MQWEYESDQTEGRRSLQICSIIDILLLSLSPADIRNRVYRSFVTTCYSQQVEEKGDHCEYCVPAVKRKLCLTSWLYLMNLSNGKYDNWRALSVKNRDVLPLDHGLVSFASNAAELAARAAVRQFVTDITRADGHPLPIRMRHSDGNLTDVLNHAVSVFVLRTRYNKRSLH